MIRVHGYLGTLTEAMNRDVADSALVVGGRRHLDALGVPEDKRQVLGLIGPAIERIQSLPTDSKVTVVASGDPMFFGVVRRMRQAGLRPEVITAPSSLQAAFAAIALPWDDAQLVSSHTGGIESAIRVAKVHPKVGVLTAPHKGLPELVAGLAGLGRYYVVAERIGEENQRIRILDEDAARAVVDAEDLTSPYVVLVLAHHPDDPAEIGVSPELVGDVNTPGPQDPTPGSDTNPDGSDRTPIIGQIINTDAAIAHAEAIDKALGVTTRKYPGPATAGLVEAWGQCDLIVSHLALGATTRIIAPLLASKKTDPGVVVVDEAGRFAIPLVGGHVGGANGLARQISEALGGTAVVSTATDSLGVPALDQLGWSYEGDVAGVTGAIIAGRPVAVVREHRWPLPPLPRNVSEDAASPVAQIIVTDRTAQSAPAGTDGLPTVVLHPRSLVVGMGCNSGTDVEALRALFDKTLADAGLAVGSVSALLSHEVKAGELGLIKLAHQLGVEYRTYPADVLAAQDAPNPSQVVAREVGTGSVSEASVLAAKAELIVPKHKTSEATCAVGRIPARGHLAVVGLGPGSRDLLAPRAMKAIQDATFVAGYAPYVRQIRDLVRPGVEILATKMGTEEERTEAAIEAARAGNNVAFVCGGDPAIYAMASPTLEMGTDGIDVEIVPGITAELAISAILGAPLGHDHATISLSDLHTDWDLILKRVHAAAEGDLVTTFYNPRSRTRTHQLPDALAIMAEHRPPTTPVAMISHAERRQQEVIMSTLAEFKPEWVGMTAMVVVGSSTTKYVTSGDGRQMMVTPRDYHWMDGAISAHSQKNYSHRDLPKADDASYFGQRKARKDSADEAGNDGRTQEG
ncbi:precorrin-3B C(17)-methyltransferase [Acidipropionibacterium jensenii]|uniref:Cobalt-precorrin-3B C(17)-methyltransferase n=3 Tax=Acidipropionibacterium jensenii TaxID=1749 RepID=A0A448P363_9ACTN|nr:precorrin-3B C(17)-methyltransferase [Acidipropionibacterium jensenii]MDN5976804.1 precorrin-3B C(17)-methyltransferase [Acidipropionibacterium jensenii]MDN6426085.1 precorrin-3B C(17)-methyltransferase [Acidipropionibacterium jensenii]MDN6440784.1 precorrin-3B C(17)-methyltransferase [Acidipropionibacterium jensenii]MDN6480673.1 precorrin-3B C(17)-methyltransferase [Acidipropionibacterium jensenii]MDN6591443.1 precorrin-3B C(17)-methyltransferase [Acidipropionibacterium jensenii]